MSAAMVTVAVVNWNTRELLRRCLASLASDHENGDAEVWVVDNASSDGSADMVAREFPWVALLASSENLGFGPAVNLVAERTDSPWVAAANADVALRPGALDAMLAAAASTGVGVVAPRLVMPDGGTQHSVHSFPGPALGVVVNLGLGRLIPPLGRRLCLEGRWDPSRARRVDWAHGAWLLIRRQAFDAVGGFDPEQWMYAEDLDLCWRLARAGWATIYDPSAEVLHEVSAATRRAFASERHQLDAAAAYAWLARRRGAWAAWVYAALNLAGTAVRYLVVASLALAFPGRFGTSRARCARFLRSHRAGLRRRHLPRGDAEPKPPDSSAAPVRE